MDGERIGGWVYIMANRYRGTMYAGVTANLPARMVHQCCDARRIGGQRTHDNTLKHAFVDRDGGVISLSSLVDETGCHVNFSDDGTGLRDGAVWPQPGKLSAVIIQSLRQNAKAEISVQTAPDEGLTVDIFFSRQAALPQAG